MNLTRAIGVLWLTIGPLAAPAPALVQERPDEWGSPRVRGLMERAIERRASWTAGADLRDYRAEARGHIYFLFDLGRESERHLVKADQLALNLFWRSPGETRQVIVGRREKKALPTGIRYHLDHLTVVMDNFGDRIRMGEGSEVRDALHPAASGALAFYEYRLTDSLTLVLPDREVRVYRVAVRPRDPHEPAIVGTLFLDRTTADIVRMEFTFTAASYLDPQLDYINVRLENALWEGRYWLPYRQGLELRRELRALDFPAGGIIRAEFRISDYRFNLGLSDRLFAAPNVTHLPYRVRSRYEFEEGLYAGLDPATAREPPSLEGIRSEAHRMIASQQLRRAEGLRLAVPGASSILRFRRAEGVYIGPGVSHRFPGGVDVTALAGRAFGADRWELGGTVRLRLSNALTLEGRGFVDRSADATPWPASSGVVGTLGALVDGEDYRQPYWTSGGAVTLERRWDRTRGRLSLGWERWETARLEADDIIDRRYRPVAPSDEGEAGLLVLELERPAATALEAVGGASWSGRLEAATRTLAGDFDYVRAQARMLAFWPSMPGELKLRLSGALGASGGGRLPAQRLFPVGGRGTVRGYPFAGFTGNLYGALGIELSRSVWYPFLTVAAFSDIAWVGLEGESAERAATVLATPDAPAESRGPLVGVGGGAGLLFDIVRIELARGLAEGGIWELMVRIRPQFWGWL